MASGCERCGMRKRYESKPKSLLGRLWRWHSGWCPGWRAYVKGLDPDARASVEARLGELDAQAKRP